MNTQEIQTPTLHESDIATLKQIAVFVAQEIAKKATATDEIHSCTVALEEELQRINQLNGMKPEMVYKNIKPSDLRAFNVWKEREKLKQQN